MLLNPNVLKLTTDEREAFVDVIQKHCSTMEKEKISVGNHVSLYTDVEYKTKKEEISDTLYSVFSKYINENN